MINTLYEPLRFWSDGGTIWIISDTHFNDKDCKYMDANWPSPQEYIDSIKKKITKHDTLIHLGDVGEASWLDQIRAYKILITGNHDKSSEIHGHFDEIYNGPFFISDKILLSHEPMPGCHWVNIHGHEHNTPGGLYIDGYECPCFNLAANCVNYKLYNLEKDIINSGVLKCITSIHRSTIDGATDRKNKRISNNS